MSESTTDSISESLLGEEEPQITAKSQDFKALLIQYQKKVKATIEALIQERDSFKDRVEELEAAATASNDSVLAELQEELQSLKEVLQYKDAEIEQLRAKVAELKANQEKPNKSVPIQIQQAESSPSSSPSQKTGWMRTSGLLRGEKKSEKSESSSPPSKVSKKETKEHKSKSEPPLPSAATAKDLNLERRSNTLPLPDEKLSPASPGRTISHTMSTDMVNGIDISNMEDVDEDIVLGLDSKTGQIEIKAGTLPKLIERLCYHNTVEPDFVPTFLLMYRSFTTPRELLDLMIQRYHVDFPVTNPQETDKVESKKKIIKLRVGNVLRSWLMDHFQDFIEDPELLKKVEDFVNNTLSKDYDSLAKQLRKFFSPDSRPSSSTPTTIEDFNPPPCISPKSKDNFLDFDVVEVARQLTIIEQSLFRAIRPEEFLDSSFSKKDKELRAPNVAAMIRRFNLVSTWVATEIVKRDEKERVTLIKNFIRIAEELKNLGNFNGMIEVLSGLQNKAIYRLKKSWEVRVIANFFSFYQKVQQSKVWDVYQELQRIASTNDNYKVYRDALKAFHHAPCVPFLGVYLTDLTFMEDGNKNCWLERDDLINFQKRRLISGVIREIQQYQQYPYMLAEERIIREYLEKIEGLTEKALYKYSLLCEPRGRDTISTSHAKNFFKKW